jgi:hypothetical protein
MRSLPYTKAEGKEVMKMENELLDWTSSMESPPSPGFFVSVDSKGR